MRQVLIHSLYRVLAEREIQTSGNIENRLRSMEHEDRLKISDGYVPTSGLKTYDAYALGLDLGRDIREKTVYRVSIGTDHYFFVGKESEIIRKIEEAGGLTDTASEDSETIELLEKEINEL